MVRYLAKLFAGIFFLAVAVSATSGAAATAVECSNAGGLPK